MLASLRKFQRIFVGGGDETGSFENCAERARDERHIVDDENSLACHRFNVVRLLVYATEIRHSMPRLGSETSTMTQSLEADPSSDLQSASA